MNNETQADRELKAWREVVLHLRETACLPDSDFTARVGTTETPGQKLITAIRQWGEERAALRLEIEREA